MNQFQSQFQFRIITHHEHNPMSNLIVSPFFFFLSICFSFIFIPLISSLSTVSVSQTSNQTLICALVPCPNNTPLSSLNCSSYPVGIQIRVNPNTSFSGIVAGDGFLCALSTLNSSTSTVVCWRFSVNGTNMKYKRIYHGPALSEFAAGNTITCALAGGATTSRLECWPRRKFIITTATSFPQNLSTVAIGGDFVCGLSRGGDIICSGSNGTNATIGQPPPGKYGAVAAGFRHACAITYGNNSLVCWGNKVGEMARPQGEFTSLALGENRSCALRTNETIVCWGRSDFRLPDRLQNAQFITIAAKRDVFCGVLKYNYSLYCWGDEVLDSNLKVFDAVLPGPCQYYCPDGILQGSGNLCPEGQQICQHCRTNSPLTGPMSPPQPSLPSDKGSGSSEWSGRNIAFLVVGSAGSLVLLLVACFFAFKYCKCRGCRVHDSGRLDDTGAPIQQNGNSSQRQNPQNAQAVGAETPILEKRLSELASMGNAGQLEEFSLQELLESTGNFSEDRKIGTGSFGVVYHGVLQDGREVAIKRAELSSTSTAYATGTRRQEDKDNAFINELESLPRLHHKNLVRLLGFYDDSNERILVYEFMQNGSLHDHLHKIQCSPLMSWTARIKVALDAARGIEYLHEYAVPRIIHRDIKSSNILLDLNWTAKVSDFGLSLMGPEDIESHLSLRAAGTVGYMDPEYYRLQQLTTKSDVYSFAVLLLEILSGRKAIHKNENGVPRNVVDYIVPYIAQDEIHRVLDKRVPPPTPFEIEAVIYIGCLAADCVTLEGRDRPSMSDIVNSLDKALDACLVHPNSLSRSTTGSST